MQKTEFESRLRELVSSQGRRTENVSCLACDRCEGCVESTFCKDGKNLARCNYCTACADCTDCGNCDRCTSCFGCTHCTLSERLTASAYVVKSIGLSGCTYCFGCVGLKKKDFHILNEPYDRQTYFSIVNKLSRELGVS
jgi:hypothetical protein